MDYGTYGNMGAQMPGMQMPPQQGKHQKGAPQQNLANPGMDMLINEIRDVSRRIRTQEERYNSLVNKSQITESNMLNRSKRFNTEIKTLNSEITEINKSLSEIKDRMSLIIRELQVMAKREEVEILKKYVNIWEPVNFATRNEVVEIVREELNRQKTRAGVHDPYRNQED